uniref:Uncharacterized protein n=1 Tax=Arundo donax TaxID=35708 RepID=A0A0A9C9L3_ARUDO
MGGILNSLQQRTVSSSKTGDLCRKNPNIRKLSLRSHLSSNSIRRFLNVGNSMSSSFESAIESILESSRIVTLNRFLSSFHSPRL